MSDATGTTSNEPEWTAAAVRRLIVDYPPKGVPGRKLLDHIRRVDHPRFIAICHALVQDEHPRVKWAVLIQLGQHGDRDDAHAETLILASVDLSDTTPPYFLGDHALFALGTIGTEHAFAVLEPEARLGRADALSAAARQARTELQRAQIIHLARDVFRPGQSYTTHLPDAALRALVLLSSIEDEEDLLMDFLEHTQDEIPLVIEVLGLASPRILPRLGHFQANYPVGSVIYRMCEFSIQEILHPFPDEQLLKHHVALRWYLKPTSSKIGDM